MKVIRTQFPTLNLSTQKAPQRKPCATCENVRAHMPKAIRKRLEAVEARMINGKR